MSEGDAQIVESLLISDDGFRRLHEQHQALKRQVHDAAEGDVSVDDLTLGEIKKRKLMAKDQMAAMIEEYRRTH